MHCTVPKYTVYGVLININGSDKARMPKAALVRLAPRTQRCQKVRLALPAADQSE